MVIDTLNLWKGRNGPAVARRLLRTGRVLAAWLTVGWLASCGGGSSSNTPVDPVALPITPTITAPPSSTSVQAGQVASFSVTATGSAPLTYQWQKNGVAIAGATLSSYATPATSTTDDGALFSVVVNNPAGSVTSQAGRLTVSASATAVTSNYLATYFGAMVSHTEAFADGVKSFSSADLVVLDGETNDPPTAVEVAGTWALGLPVVPQANIGANGVSSDSQVRAWSYLKGGRLFVLDLQRGTAFPQPRQVSAITAPQVCGGDLRGEGATVLRYFSDLRDALRSGIVFRLPGADGLCGGEDDTYRAVTFDMAATHPGIATPEYITGVNDLTGTLVGHIVRSGNKLQRVDTAFANPVDLFATSGAHVNALRRDGDLLSTSVFVYQDGNDVRAFNLATLAGPVTVATVAPGESTFVYNSPGETYLQVFSANASRLLSITDALTVTTLATEAAMIGQASTTSTHLIYTVSSGLSKWVRSVPKAGGAPSTLVGCNRPTIAQAFAFTFGDNIYCGPFATLPSLTEAAAGVTVLKADGTVVRTVANAAIVGIGNLNPLAAGTRTLQTVLLAEGLSTTTLGYSGSTLRLYDGTSGATLADYGVFTVNATFMSSVLFQFPSVPKLLRASNGGQLAADSDLFVLRDQPPTLTRRTQNLPQR